MKITNIRCLVADAGGRNILFVKTETDEGITGIGEAYCVGPDLAVAATIDYLKEWLVGEDPRNIEYLWALMYQGLRFPPGSVGLAAISGIEHTLWDISAKALGLPVYRLLGGQVRDKVRVYQSCHGRTPEEAAEHALSLIDRYGYTALKMSPYPPNSDSRLWNDVLREGPRFLEAVRKAVGDDVDIMVDAGGSDQYWHGDLKWAMEAARMLAHYNVVWFEEALRADDLEGYRQLRAASPVHISAGEVITRRQNFYAWIEARALDIVQPDLCIVGGLSEGRRIAWAADDHHILVVPHGWNTAVGLAADLHLTAAIPNARYVEYWFPAPYVDGILAKPFRLDSNGLLAIPTGPGLGIEVDEEKVRHYARAG